jgi:hypothetical protein
MGLPARFEDWTREHARLMWRQVWPGAQQQLQNFNKYLRHLKINERYDLKADEWEDFNLTLLTTTLYPGHSKEEYMKKFDDDLEVQPMNLGQYMSPTRFTFILRHSAWAFCDDETQWDVALNSRQWSMISSFIDAFNACREKTWSAVWPPAKKLIDFRRCIPPPCKIA